MKAHERTIHVASCALLLLGLSASAQDDRPTGGPRLVVDRTRIELPELTQGQTTKIQVELHNAGDAPLVLSLVDVTCGCTVVEYPREPIAAGEKRTLILDFDSTDKAGPVNVDVFLYSNDPTQRDRGAYCTNLKLTGEVGSNFRVLPRSAAFGEVLAGSDSLERTIRVSARGPARKGMKLTPRAVPDYMQVSVEPGKDESKANIRVKLLASAPTGDLLHYLEFDTGIAEQPTLRLPVVATVTGRVRGPSGVYLRQVQRGTEGTLERIPLSLSDVIEGVPSNTLPIRRLDFDRARLHVEVEHISPRRADLLVRSLSEAPLGSFSAPITVYFDLAEQPRLVVPVFGHVEGRVRCSPPALAQGNRELIVSGGKVSKGVLEPALAGVRVELVPTDGGTQVRLVGGELNGEAKLVLTTDVPGEERVVVEVFAAPK